MKSSIPPLLRPAPAAGLSGRDRRNPRPAGSGRPRTARIRSALAGLLLAAGAAATEPISGFFLIPHAGVTPHARYELGAAGTGFSRSTLIFDRPADSVAADTLEEMSLPYLGRLRLGFLGRAEAEIEMGERPGLSFKARLIEEDGVWPDAVFGLRNLFSSAEGRLYDLGHSLSESRLGREGYFALGKTLGSGTRLGGGMALAGKGMKGGFGLFGGLEQPLGGGAFLSYEVFERFAEFHHVLGFTFKHRDILALSAGFTEFQAWLRQEGSWGFHARSAEALSHGYGSPGAFVSLQLRGFLPRLPRKTLGQRVLALEADKEKGAKEEATLADRLRKLEGRLASLEDREKTVNAQPKAPEGGAAAEEPAALLRAFEESGTGESFDPARSRLLGERLLALGETAVPLLRGVFRDSTRSLEVRARALALLGQGRNPAHLADFDWASRRKEALLRREAALALVRLGSPASLKRLEGLRSDPDEGVRLAARTVPGPGR